MKSRPPGSTGTAVPVAESSTWAAKVAPDVDGLVLVSRGPDGSIEVKDDANDVGRGPW
jgi:hypothetical protein